MLVRQWVTVLSQSLAALLGPSATHLSSVADFISRAKAKTLQNFWATPYATALRTASFLLHVRSDRRAENRCVCILFGKRAARDRCLLCGVSLCGEGCFEQFHTRAAVFVLPVARPRRGGGEAGVERAGAELAPVPTATTEAQAARTRTASRTARTTQAAPAWASQTTWTWMRSPRASRATPASILGQRGGAHHGPGPARGCGARRCSATAVVGCGGRGCGWRRETSTYGDGLIVWHACHMAETNSTLSITSPCVLFSSRSTASCGDRQLPLVAGNRTSVTHSPAGEGRPYLYPAHLLARRVFRALSRANAEAIATKRSTQPTTTASFSANPEPGTTTSGSFGSPCHGLPPGASLSLGKRVKHYEKPDGANRHRRLSAFSEPLRLTRRLEGAEELTWRGVLRSFVA